MIDAMHVDFDFHSAADFSPFFYRRHDGAFDAIKYIGTKLITKNAIILWLQI
jgi:hypothetical protein